MTKNALFAYVTSAAGSELGFGYIGLKGRICLGQSERHPAA
jgi:hypothetical protein